MLFTELVHAIHGHLMNDSTVPDFMRNLIQMLCDIPESDWNTKRDPSSPESCSDESLKKFYTKGLSKKLAKKMLSHVTRDNFLESIYDADRSDVVLEGLARDIAPFSEEPVTAENVGEKLFALLERALETTLDPALDNERLLQEAKTLSQKAKGKFGTGLLEDCKNYCSMPGCQKHLHLLLPDGQSLPNYEIIRIDEAKPAAYDNILAVCPDCFQIHTLSKHTTARKNTLKAQKQCQTAQRESQRLLAEATIDKSIVSVIESLGKLKASDFEILNYSPVPLKEKIPSNFPFLKSTVAGYVIQYYQYIERTMKQLSLENRYNDDLVRAEIKTIYRDMAKKTNDKTQIFQNLAGKLSSISNQNILPCSVIIAYFIQSCEVFDAPSK